MPRDARCSLTSRIVRSPSCQRDAASTASARPVGERLGEVLGRAGAARGHHGHRDGAGDRAQQLEVVALAGAVAVHRRQQDLARAVPGGGLGGPLDRVTVRGRAPGIDEHVPAPVAPLRVDRDDHALRPEAVGAPRQQRRVAHSRAVHAHLVCPGTQERVHVVVGPDAPADRQRDEDLLGRARHDVQGRLPILQRGRDVEEHELVGALAVVVRRQLHGVARVAELLEPHALDDATGVDVEAGDHALREHRLSPSSPATASASSRTGPCPSPPPRSPRRGAPRRRRRCGRRPTRSPDGR